MKKNQKQKQKPNWTKKKKKQILCAVERKKKKNCADFITNNYSEKLRTNDEQKCN